MRRPVKITTAGIHDRADMQGNTGVGAAAGCDLLIFSHSTDVENQKIAACGSSYVDRVHP
jgi:hypothetical protein